uniref:Pentatricopeptide repeat-containing protein n=1 Tax=Ananas comosus var. bracteatus TaxID=296719 RepID=A0A6V7QUD4_ANACO
MLRRRVASRPLLLHRASTSISSSPFTSHYEKNPNSNAPNPQTRLSLPLAPYAFVQILSSATKSFSLSMGEQLHAAIVKLCFDTNLFISTALLNFYFCRGRFACAQKLFDEMPRRNVVTWNTLVYGYSQSHVPNHAVKAFAQMVYAGVILSPSSVSSVLVACSKLEDMDIGTMVHCVGLKSGFCSNVVVGTALVDMCAKCRDMGAARRVFDEMKERNVITWTSLLSGYSLEHRSNDAMLLFREMRQQCVELNEVTYSSLISSFSRLEDMVHGEQVHSLVVKEGLEAHHYIAVALLTMYSKCGSLQDFNKVCQTVPFQDQISSNSIMAGFSHFGNGKEVLERFLLMRRERIGVDFFTFVSVLKAIGILPALEEGKQIHALIFKTGHGSSVCIQNGLVSMYAKCGAIYNSKQVFSSMEDPDLVSWNSLLSGCAQHGYGKEAIELFEQMKGNEIRPDHTTFLSVLTACSHVGLVEKGLGIFYLMKGDPQTFVGLEHYACIIDLLGRAGYLTEAEALVNEMPIKPGVSVYRALLSACLMHGNLCIAKRMAEKLFRLRPNDPSTHILFSNIFASDGWWDSAAGVRENMREKGVKKEAASSWIENRTLVA